jgi:cyclic pyranopterin phosphate synthase
MMSTAVLNAPDELILPAVQAVQGPRLRDRHGRAITDLRVYCRTGNEGAQFSELPIADYMRMIGLFVSLGVEKVRLTGGEPLLRAGLLEMIQELSSLRTAYTPEGAPTTAGHPLDIALTTNGHLLSGLAQPLKDAGLSRITVSMDAVDPETFTAITRVPRSFDRVLAGIRAATAAGLGQLRASARLQ